MIHDRTEWASDSDEAARAESFQYRVLEMCMARTARMNINRIGDEGDAIRIRANLFQLASQMISLNRPNREKLSIYHWHCLSLISRCTNTTIRHGGPLLSRHIAEEPASSYRLNHRRPQQSRNR
jgi:hypothetical protein